MSLYIKINQLLKKKLKFSIEPDSFHPAMNIIELFTIENSIEFRQKFVLEENAKED